MCSITLENDILDLLNDDQGVCDRVKEWINAQLKHCSKSFTKYENTIRTSQELVKGLYAEDVCVQLLVAPTQMGKTSTMFWTLYNLMTHMNDDCFVPYPFAFIITGLNSNSWKEQTKERVLPSMRENVWHNKDLCKADNVKRLKDAVLSDYNTIIVIDEVHVGTKLDHVIFNTLREFHPRNETHEISQQELFEFLYSKRVKFLLVSATPDAIKETMEHNWDEKRFRTIVAYPDPSTTYVWHKDFLNAGRVHQSFELKQRDEKGRLFHRVIAKRISEYDRPLYHMIRFPMDTKSAEIEKSKELLKNSIQALNVYADIVEWDAKNTIKKYFEYRNYDVFENSEIKPNKIMTMKNEAILKQKPKRHVIFILKEFFRVAQTMPIDNIGVLVDRDTKTPCDSTLSQSLIGRACGYDKEVFIKQIQIYTNVQSVKNYVKLWESKMDYAKVPEYVGNGIRTTKNGLKLKSNETMMGQKVERVVPVPVIVPITKITENKKKNVVKVAKVAQEDTFERLEKVRITYMKEDTIVRKIIDMYVDNAFKPLSEQQINMCGKAKKINMNDYTTWNDEHYRFNILENNGDALLFSLRAIIRNHLAI